MTARSESIPATARAAFRGSLPERYVVQPHELWRYWFDRRVDEVLRPGMTVLDVGAGRKPAVTPDRRPDGVRYLGLDLDPAELDRAPEGSYDEVFVADVVDVRPDLEERFDLVLSLFVFEHVRPLDVALENIRRYLKPGGVLVAQLAGGRSVHGFVNAHVPHRLARTLAYRATRKTSYREADSVFPAHYDRCHDSALRATLARWSEVDILPQYLGAKYFLWWPVATAAYVAYEEWTVRRGMADLATWYLVTATR